VSKNSCLLVAICIPCFSSVHTDTCSLWRWYPDLHP